MRQHRVLAPGQLLDWLAERLAKKEVCIECGAGLGELAGYYHAQFRQVIASDIAPPTRKSPYGVTITRAAAEQLPLADSSVDLLISMQALHHFDRVAHLVEAARVLRSGGVFAALCWGEIHMPAQVLRAFQPTLESLAPYWEESRAWVLSGYAGLAFPGTLLDLPAARLTRQMTLSDLKAEIRRWSAFRRATAAGVAIPDPDQAEFDQVRTFPVHWPILGRAFQV